MSPEVTATLDALRARLTAGGRQVAEQARAGADGYGLAALRTRIVDAVVEELCQRCVPAADVAAFHLFAVGGYGRGHLAPGSDLDILLVHEREAGLEQAGARLERALWDCGLRPSVLRATPAELATLVREPETATACLDARIVGQDREAAVPLRQLLCDTIQAQAVPLVRRLLGALHLSDVAALRQLYRLEPNLKQDPFLLRAVQRIHWVARLVQPPHEPQPWGTWPLLSPAEREPVVAAYGFLLRVRTALHLLAGRQEDVILTAYQPQLAAWLGCAGDGHRSAEEVFLRDLYSRERQVCAAAHRVVELLEQDARFAGRRPQARYRRWLAPGFVRVGNSLHLGVRAEQHWGQAPALDRLVEPFVLLCEGRLDLPLALRNALRAAARAAPPPDTDALRRAGAWFRRLLSAHQPVGPIIVNMHACDVLGLLLPEFGALTCAAEFSHTHQYTIDAHSLLALCEVETLLGHAAPRAAEPYRVLCEAITDLTSLRLAALLHDCGKVLPGRHSDTGAGLAEAAAKRLGCSPDVVSEVEFLVRQHLLLSHACQQRDTEDATLVTAVAAQIRTRRRLALLVLLTYADMRTVRDGLWTGWKDEQLLGLCRRVAAALEEADHGQTDFTRALALYQAEREAPVSAQVVVAHVAQMAWADYVEHVPFRRIVEHAAAALQYRAGHADLSREARTHTTRVRVVAADARGFFTTLTGALTGAGLRVVQGWCFTRRDGIVIDEVEVEDALSGGPLPDVAWPVVREQLRQALAGEVDVQALVVRQRRTFPVRRSPRTNVSVRVDNDSSAHHSIVDIRAGDRAGLLFELGGVFESQGVDIRFVKISTHGGQAQDSFSVVDARGDKLSPTATRLLVAALERVLEPP